ncbi:MAG: 23S rRNA (guanosine(2251)-2'-O)-methyltransferase RlmB [Chitinispirillaceae bacterium]|jgi:23S rRNA (guanosine2251-2'-O)-methyltransferase
MEPATAVYGIHAVEELLEAHLEMIDHIYFDTTKRSSQLFTLMKICRKERLAYNLVPPQKLVQLAGTDKHQGVVALRSIQPYCTLEDLKIRIAGKTSPLFVLAPSVEDPQNLGALIRSCVAFGVDALFLERKNTAPLSPAVAKASAGMVEHCTIVRPKNLEGIIREYGASGFTIVGTSATVGIAPSKINFTSPVIIVLGGEHRGIPPYLEKLCTCFAAISINQQVQSLNVAAAGAIILYECSRQRGRQ